MNDIESQQAEESQGKHSTNDQDVPSVEQLQEEVNHWKEKYLRSVAEMANTRKRLESLYASQFEQEKRRILIDMLTLADNLERALQYAKVDDNHHGLRRGVELTLKALLDTLKKYDVQPIEAEGKPFDTMLHEAVGTIRSADHQPGTVVKVEQQGYLQAGELLRPARVVVAD